MTALTNDRDTRTRDGMLFELPVAAAAHIFAGGLVAVNASGFIVPTSADETLKVFGRAEAEVDNSGGSNGDLSVEILRGVFYFENSATDAISRADIGKVCFAEDDQTVAQTNASGTLPAAGLVLEVDSYGVLVAVGQQGLAANPAAAREAIGVNKLFLPIPIGNLAGATGTVYRFTSPVAGTITKLTSVLEAALTTGDATITPSIGGVAVTDGALTITQASSAAGDVDTASPSALNTVTAGQAVALTVGGTNDATASAMLMVEITY